MFKPKKSRSLPSNGGKVVSDEEVISGVGGVDKSVCCQ